MLVSNLALVFGTLAETVELWLAIIMMISGIIITHLIQKWADSAGEHPAAANVGLSGSAERREPKTMRQ
ncbi:MAG TPA: hypothetical protein VGR22_11625 [Thermomicrobiales bacterium]|nr:hypothetical protein [Thermomicrobiales bacterium]